MQVNAGERTVDPATPFDAFEHLIGERMTVDMKTVVIATIELKHRRPARAVDLEIALRERPARGDSCTVFVTCADDRPPMWVLDEHRKRELHNGSRYDLGSRRA